MLRVPELQQAGFTYKLEMLNRRDFYFLLLTVFSVKLPNDNKNILKTFLAK